MYYHVLTGTVLKSLANGIDTVCCRDGYSSLLGHAATVSRALSIALQGRPNRNCCVCPLRDMTGQFNPRDRYSGWCQNCRSPEKMADIRLPYACKLLFQVQKVQQYILAPYQYVRSRAGHTNAR